MALSVLTAAREAAVRFLDEASKDFAVRIAGSAPDSSKDVWRLIAEAHVAGVTEVQLVLPDAFPAVAPNIFILGGASKGLPHIEARGRVCLNVETFGTDYDRPVELIRRTLTAFEDYLRRCEDSVWVQKEFAHEAELYWNNYCNIEADRLKRFDVPLGVLLFDELTAENEARLRIQTGRSHLGKWAHVTVGDPNTCLRRHGLRAENMGRARLLVIRLDDGDAWAPGIWPKSYAALVAFARKHRPDAASFFSRGPRRGKARRAHLTERFVLVTSKYGHYAYQIREAALPLLELPTLLPLPAMRMDAQWCLTRDENARAFTRRQEKRVVVFGAGSLAAPTIDLLARAGIGRMEVIDFDRFAPENIARHSLGIGSVGMNKAEAVARRVMRDVPGASVQGFDMRAEEWLAAQGNLGGIDAIVDLTGSGGVRMLVSRLVKVGELKAPVVLGWMEPFGSAAHVVSLVGADRWADDDPVDLLAMAEWPAEAEIRLPGCGVGFHPYGASDAARAAAMVTESVLDVVDGKVRRSCVSSFKRSVDYLDDLPVVARGLSRNTCASQYGEYVEQDFAEIFREPADVQ
jgi:hypothetical protein